MYEHIFTHQQLLFSCLCLENFRAYSWQWWLTWENFKRQFYMLLYIHIGWTNTSQSCYHSRPSTVYPKYWILVPSCLKCQGQDKQYITAVVYMVSECRECAFTFIGHIRNLFFDWSLYKEIEGTQSYHGDKQAKNGLRV